MMRHAPCLACLALVALLMGFGAHAGELRMDGEVYARDTLPLMPPAVDGMWQYNISQIAPDGREVKEGEPVLSFDGAELAKRLVASQSELREKQAQLQKLTLDHAEQGRSEQVKSAEARVQRDKAQRKTQQPEALIAGVEYRKLMIERRAALEREALVLQRERLAAEQRRQEMRELASAVDRLEIEIAKLQQDIASLQVLAPRDGLMMHRSSWNGEKFDAGSQVWRGQTVAEIPDESSLAVRATLMERDLLKVAEGAAVRVRVEGGAGSTRRGTVASVGRAVRSRSRLQPVPVVDVDITLDAGAGVLRPGQSVRVEMDVPDEVGMGRAR